MAVRSSNWWEHIKKNKVNLPVCIQEEIKPIFQGLTNVDMLSKYLHGMTQNSNESFNQLVWNRCPKSVFTSRPTVETAVNSSVIVYNDGFLALASVFEHIGLQPRVFFVKCAQKKNFTRIYSMDKKSTDKTKKRRKSLRSIRKGLLTVRKIKKLVKHILLEVFSAL